MSVEFQKELHSLSNNIYKIFYCKVSISQDIILSELSIFSETSKIQTGRARIHLTPIENLSKSKEIISIPYFDIS